MKVKLILAIFFIGFINITIAQNDLVIEVLTDNYPSETSWVLFDINGNIVEERSVFNKEETHYDTIQVSSGDCYFWTIYDTYGDGMSRVGGGDFNLYLDGELIASCIDANFGDSTTVYNIGKACSANDILLEQITTLADVSNKDTVSIKAKLINTGASPITSIKASYKVNNGTSIEHEFTGLNIALGHYYEFIFPEAHNFTSVGNASLTVTVNEVNGSPDAYNVNNSLTKQLNVVDGYIKRNLFEIFTTAGTGCPTCYSEVQGFYKNMIPYEGTFDYVNFMCWDFADKKWSLEVREMKEFYSAIGLSNIRFNLSRIGWGNDPVYEDSLGEVSPLKIVPSGEVKGDSVYVSCKITSLVDINVPMFLRGLLNEGTCYDVALEYNNQNPYKNVVLAFADGVYGFEINSLKAGETKEVSRVFSFDEFPVEDDTYKDLQVLFYAQNIMDKKILQSAATSLDYTKVPFTIEYNVANNETNVDTTALAIRAKFNRILYGSELSTIENYDEFVQLRIDNALGVNVPMLVDYDAENNELSISPKYGWLTNTTYYVNIDGFMSVDNQAPENTELVFTTEKNVGTNQTKNNDVNVFPNPAKSEVSITVHESGNIQILNAAGKMVFTQKIVKGNNNIEIGELNKGIYFIKIESKSTQTMHKLIKE